MLVRDKTLPKTEYKGRLTDACEAVCPCRPCYNAHDCGYMQYHGWVVNMECAVRYNNGCPYVDGHKHEPVHIYRSDQAKVCIRCGYRRS